MIRCLSLVAALAATATISHSTERRRPPSGGNPAARSAGGRSWSGSPGTRVRAIRAGARGACFRRARIGILIDSQGGVLDVDTQPGPTLTPEVPIAAMLAPSTGGARQ